MDADILSVECSDCGVIRRIRPNHQTEKSYAKRSPRCAKCEKNRRKRRVLVTCLGCEDVREMTKSAARGRARGYCHKCALRLSAKRRKREGAERRAKTGPQWYKHSGYMRAHWPEHVIAASNGIVTRSWHILWEESGRAAWVKRAKDMKATIHHKNGVRDDDRPENLELRWPGRHPKGWTTDAMIETLKSMGYEVRKDS